MQIIVSLFSFLANALLLTYAVLLLIIWVNIIKWFRFY